MNKEFPQTRAEVIGKYGCLAMCYLYCVGIDGTIVDYIKYVSDAMDRGLLDGECTVLDASEFLEAFTGKRFNVEKKVCVSIANIKEPTPVQFYYFDSNGKRHEHWVVVENGEIVFNSLSYSNCVQKGKPSKLRVITLA